MPAFVTHVWSAFCVNLMPIGNKAGASEYSSCSHQRESDESLAAAPNGMRTANGTWSWPPRVPAAL